MGIIFHHLFPIKESNITVSIIFDITVKSFNLKEINVLDPLHALQISVI
jgi:hypothetical protein